MRMIAPILLSAAALCAAVPLPASTRDAAGLFDKPVKVDRIPLAPDPLNPRAKPMLSCFHYRGFMVKQIDRGEKGAEQLSIRAVKTGEGKPPCVEANAPGEKIVDDKDWHGYFKGVKGEKGDYVFFSADDGWNGGVGFAVFGAADGRKRFEDVAKSIHAVHLTKPKLVLRYRRVYGAPCSLVADAAGCWSKVKRETGLSGKAPGCAAAYRQEEKKAGANASGIAADPSVIEYEAETVLDGTRHKTKPRPGKITCKPAI